MENIEQYDVVIAGANPAGLYFAKELAPHFSVLAIEKRKNLKTKKFWVSWEKNVKDNKLEDCVVNVAPAGHFSFYNGKDIKFHDALCWVLDSQKVISKWQKEFEKNGTLALGTTFLNYKDFGSHLLVKTNKGFISTRLLIDAMGRHSHLAGRSGNLVEKLICSNLAGIYTNVEHLGRDAIVFAVMYPSRPRVYFEYFPISRKRGILEIFYFAKKQYSEQKMKDDLNKHIELLSKGNKKKPKLISKHMGYIAMNKIKKSAFNRVLLVGDAGGWPPRSTGAGFNEILHHGKEVCNRLKKLLKVDCLSQEDLTKVLIYTPLEIKNREIQEIIGYFIRNARDSEVGRVFKVLKKLPPDIVPNFIRLELTNEQIRKTLRALAEEFSLWDFIKAVPKGSKFISLKHFWTLLIDFYRAGK
jgi:flavin-dependent dehydrogenase